MSVSAFPYGTFAVEFGSTSVITLSGETGINDYDGTGPTFTAQSGIRVNTDGTIDKYLLNSGGYTQIDTSTDWIRPVEDASSLYQVHLTTISPYNAPSSGDSTDTWLNLTTNREWMLTAAGSEQLEFWRWTLSIRYNGGATLDTAEYHGNVSTGT